MARRILIVGGGITGLAAAYYLLKQARTAGEMPEVVVVERETRLGGQIQTEHTEGLVIEHAPDSFLVRKPWFADLCKELDLPLVGTNPRVKKTYILNRGRLEPLPAGMQLFIPTRLRPFLKSRLLSPWGKLRALMEPFVPIERDHGDESTGHFVARRFGTEVLDKIGAPLMAGVYGGDPYDLSLKATFPQFLKMEQEKGSLLRAARKSAPAQGTTGSAFQAVATGLETVVEALVKSMEGVEYRTGEAVTSLLPTDAGYTATLSSGQQVSADAVVLTIPAYLSADLVEGYLPDVAEELRQIEYASVVVAVLAYRREDVPHPLDATGFLVPKTESLPITASTWVSSKWEHTAPPDKVILRGYLGRAGGKDWTNESDEAILIAVRDSFRQVMGLTAEPILQRVFRWPLARPRYRVGHLERVDRIDRMMAERPGLYLAGAAYRGLGLPDCVREGIVAAEKIARQLWP